MSLNTDTNWMKGMKLTLLTRNTKNFIDNVRFNRSKRWNVKRGDPKEASATRRVSSTIHRPWMCVFVLRPVFPPFFPLPSHPRSFFSSKRAAGNTNFYPRAQGLELSVSTEASNVSGIFCTTVHPLSPRKREGKGWEIDAGTPANRRGRGPSGGAHGAGFNELFHPPLVPPLNRRFHRRFSSDARPLAPRSIRVHVRFRALPLPPPLPPLFFLSEKKEKNEKVIVLILAHLHLPPPPPRLLSNSYKSEN